MIQEVKMYTVICNNCGEDIGSNSEYSCWNDKGFAEENAMESEWERVIVPMEEDKHYCPDCFSFNDNDVLVINPERKDLHNSTLAKQREKYQDKNNFRFMEDVTHWQPLPQAPKPKESEK